MLPKTRLLSGMIVVALLATAMPTKSEAELPEPGELLAVNALALVDGACVGNVTIGYGFMPTQVVRRWSYHVEPDCDIVLSEARAPGITPATWAPVNIVSFVMTSLIEYQSGPNWYRNSVTNDVRYNYGTTMSACPPSYVTHTTSYYTEATPWQPVGSPELSENACDAAFKASYHHYTPTVQRAAVDSDEGYCSASFAPQPPGSSYHPRGVCEISNTPLSNFAAESVIDTIHQGVEKLYTRGSGL